MALTIKNLSKYFGKKRLFSGFNYEFPETGMFAIQGDSGIGKTTLFRIIAGLDTNYGGELFGYDKNDISFSFQEYRLFDSLTALENITEISFENADENDQKKAKELLLKLRFTEADMMLYPSELSGGMKQRISFARAILRDSKILLLDEVTKELDTELCDIISELIREAAKARLVLLISHQSRDAEKAGATVINLQKAI